jgi:hypothetical protein
MKLGYNQGVLERSKNIAESIINFMNNNILIKIKAFYKMVFFLALRIEEIYYKLFPEQKLLKDFFKLLVKKLAKENKHMKFGMDTHQGSQKYMKGKKYRV